jgi:hypothetical protein
MPKSHYSRLVDIKVEAVRSVKLPLSGGATLFFEIFAGGRPYPDAYFAISRAKTASARVHSDIVKHILENIRNGRPVSDGPFSSVGRML